MADADELPAGFEFRAFVYGGILRTEGSRQQAAGRRQKAEGRKREAEIEKEPASQPGAILFSRFGFLPTAYCLLLAVFRRLDSATLGHDGLAARRSFSRSEPWLGCGQRRNASRNNRRRTDLDQGSSAHQRHSARCLFRK